MGAAPAESQITLRQRRLPSALTSGPETDNYYYHMLRIAESAVIATYWLVSILWNMAHHSPPEAAPPRNLFVVEAGSETNERFEDLLRRPGVRIERIVSHGHVTPLDQPYLQDWDEWVLVLEGAAELLLNGSDARTLAAGEHLLIPAGTPHLVTHTAEPTVWLAIHIGET